MNESNPGALGIPEFMPPNGGETFIVNYSYTFCSFDDRENLFSMRSFY